MALQLVMPQGVERCQRRNFYRMGTAKLTLPRIEIWPLLDHKSVVIAERASEITLEHQSAASSDPESSQSLDVEPEVGPQFNGTLLNIGGGGFGICIEPEHAQILARHKLFWTRLCLPPEMPHPICATAKLAHTHIQADHTMYAGMSFDFSLNPGHQGFVLDQIRSFIAEQQRRQSEEHDSTNERAA